MSFISRYIIDTELLIIAVVITVLNAYSGFALVAEGTSDHWVMSADFIL